MPGLLISPDLFDRKFVDGISLLMGTQGQCYGVIVAVFFDPGPYFIRELWDQISLLMETPYHVQPGIPQFERHW